MARQIFGTVLTIWRNGTPYFRCVNVSVPNVMWHQCSKFQGCRDYHREVVLAWVNKARCQKFGVLCWFFSTCKWGKLSELFWWSWSSQSSWSPGFSSCPSHPGHPSCPGYPGFPDYPGHSDSPSGIKSLCFKKRYHNTVMIMINQ